MQYGDLLLLYGLDELGIRRKRHHPAVMFRHSNSNLDLDVARPEVTLRNRNRPKFKIRTTQLTKVQESPYHRRVSLWVSLPEEV